MSLPESQEPVSRVMARVLQVSERLRPAIGPVYTESKSPEPELIGSAVFLRVGSVHFAMTASHVMAQSQDAPLYIGGAAQLVEFGGRYITSTPSGRSAQDDKYDVAVMPLSDLQLEKLRECRFLEVDELDPAEQTDYRRIVGSNYLLFGFPISKQRSMKDGALRPVHMAVAAKAAEPLSFHRHGLDPRYHLIVEYDKQSMSTGAGPTTAPDPNGTSGGGVWSLSNLHGPGSVCERLVAIPTEYTGRQGKTVLATRVGHIFDAISDFYPDLRDYMPKPAA